MDGQGAGEIVGILCDGIKGFIVAAFIMGVVIALIVGGCVWGGFYVYKHYKIVKKEETTQISTNAPPIKY
jgi:hypothetical protein